MKNNLIISCLLIFIISIININLAAGAYTDVTAPDIWDFRTIPEDTVPIEQGSYILTLTGVDFETGMKTVKLYNSSDGLIEEKACSPDTEYYACTVTSTIPTTTSGDFTYKAEVEDRAGNTARYDCATGTHTAYKCKITVYENQPPVADDQSVTVDEDPESPVTITLTASDPNNDPLTYSIVTNPTNGILSALTENTLTYTPNLNYNGADSFTFKANDGRLDSNIATVSITINPVNDAPTISITYPDEADKFTVGHSINIIVDAQDIDGNSLEITYNFGDSNITTLTDINTITHAYATNDTYTITTTVSDGTLSAEDSVSIEILPHAFNITDITTFNDAFTTEETNFLRNQSVYVNFNVIDKNDGNNYVSNAISEVYILDSEGNTIDLTAYGNGVSIIDGQPATPNGSYYYNLVNLPLNDDILGEDIVFVFSYTDAGAGQGEHIIYVANNPLTFSDLPPSITFNEDESDNTLSLNDYVSDIETLDNEIVWTYSGNTNINVDIPSSHIVTFTAAQDWNGTETISFTADDTDGSTDTKSINVTVNPVNDAPVISNIPDQTINEGETFTTINLDDYVSDADNTDAEIIWTYSGNTELTVSIASRVATITIPSIEWNGAETITFTATDPGALNDSDAAVFTVTSVNNMPVVSDIPNQTINEGETFATINLDDYVNDTDNTDAEIAWTYSGNTELIVSIVTRVATITIPSIEWNGDETITFTATDPSGLSNSDAATFTVNAVNDAPIVSDIPSQTINEGETFATINLDDYVNDTDNTDAEIVWTYSGNTELTVSIASRVATITIPSIDWNGAETITFTATDPGALSDNDAATFTVVSAGNNAPIANAGIDQNVLVLSTVTLNGLGSSDPDGDTITYSWTQVSGPMTVTLSDPAAATPSFIAPMIGAYVFQLIVNDGQVDSAPDTVLITVTSPMNHAPIANAGSDQNVVVSSEVTLDGSDSYDSDADSITYGWTQISGTSVSLSNSANVNPTFTPSRTGTYVFRLIVHDGTLYSLADTVTINVNEAPKSKEKPKIEMSSIRLPAGEFYSEGDSFDLSFNLENKGNVDIKNVRIDARIMDTGIMGSTGDFNIRRGRTVSKSLYLDIPEDMEPGDYYMKVSYGNPNSRRTKYRIITIE
jgi:hypothetical protein